MKSEKRVQVSSADAEALANGVRRVDVDAAPLAGLVDRLRAGGVRYREMLAAARAADAAIDEGTFDDAMAACDDAETRS